MNEPMRLLVWSVALALGASRAVPADTLKSTISQGAPVTQSGAGLKLSAPQVVAPQTLGATTSDLVFTPITPCRIVDTRLAGGPIAGNFTRSFFAINTASFAVQGGSATNCGTLG